MSDLRERAQKSLNNFFKGKQTLSEPPEDTDDDLTIQAFIDEYDEIREALSGLTTLLSYPQFAKTINQERLKALRTRFNLDKDTP